MNIKLVFSIVSFFIIQSTLLAQEIITSSIEVSDITTSSFKLSWTTNGEANSFIRYGNTADLELGILEIGETQFPSIEITDASPAQVFYVQAFSEQDGVEDMTDIQLFVTKSLSSGDMKVYFNQSVNHNYSSENNEAIYLPQTIDDTLVEYIKRAKESIDVAIYNTTSSSSVADYISALNEAYQNGVNVRVIYNGNTGNTGINNLDEDIPKLESPEADFSNNIGIMHNKFFVFDAMSTNPNLPIVWTGSTNLTTQQVNTDANHAVIVQDQSLAKTYVLEFNEMWGSDGLMFDEENAKWGKDKEDNTPHVFNINDKRVECYFSPSDNTNNRLIQAINEAEDELIVNTMLITLSDIADAIIDRHNNGSNVAVQLNTITQSSVFSTLQSELNGRLSEYSGTTGILHHKTMLANVLSNNNPYVFTGSHNWSASAEQRNDENTLIIYDESIVNQFFQEFMARYEPIVSQIQAVDDTFLIESREIELIDVAENDDYYFTIQPHIAVVTPPQHGIASGSPFGFVSYLADENYLGKDSLQYIICNKTIFDYCDTAWVKITVDYELSTSAFMKKNDLRIFPNPTNDKLFIEFKNSNFEDVNLKVFSTTGALVLENDFNSASKSSVLEVGALEKGIYLLEINKGGGVIKERFVIQ